MGKECKQCGKPLQGRSDKTFCSTACKNAFSFAQRRRTRDEVKEIDAYLHRNREILATLMGESKKEILDRALLTRAKFRWEYMTSIYKNKQGKWYHLVYDYAWMEFSSQTVMVIRK
jgi:predicted nucleic acid-binding Zn ribbon protein